MGCFSPIQDCWRKDILGLGVLKGILSVIHILISVIAYIGAVFQHIFKSRKLIPYENIRYFVTYLRHVDSFFYKRNGIENDEKDGETYKKGAFRYRLRYFHLGNYDKNILNGLMPFQAL